MRSWASVWSRRTPPLPWAVSPVAVPILRQGRLLVVSVPASATDQDLRGLLDDLAERVGATGASGVVIDVSGIDVLDSFATRLLETVGQVAHLRGAATVIVGIQPEVAQAMVQLGLTLDAVATALDLEDGIARLGQDTTRDERDDDDGR